MHQIGEWIGTILRDIHNDALIKKIKKDVTLMSSKFPLYPE